MAAICKEESIFKATVQLEYSKPFKSSCAEICRWWQYYFLACLLDDHNSSKSHCGDSFWQ